MTVQFFLHIKCIENLDLNTLAMRPRIFYLIVIIAILVCILIFASKTFREDKTDELLLLVITGERKKYSNNICAEFSAFVSNYSKIATKSEKVLTKWIMKSNYWQNDVTKACITVQFISEQTTLSENFPNNGLNRLFIFLHGSKPTKEFRTKHFRAIFAASDFDHGAFLPAVDIRLYINVPQQKPTIQMIFQKRKHILAMQLSVTVSTLQYNHFYNKCGETNNICQILPIKEAKFESTFLLLFTSDKANFANNLYVALSCGTIPVFIEDSSEQDLKNLLPVPDFIEWHRATIFLHRQNIDFSSLFLLLKSVPEWKMYELRRMGRFYFQHFLGDPKVLVRTILTAIRHRLHLPAPAEKTVSAEILFKLLPNNGKSETQNLNLQFFDEDIHRSWNMDPTYLDSAPKVQPYWRQSHLQYARNQINSDFYPKFGQKLSGNWLNDEKFTIVIEAFRRDIGLLYTLRSLNGLRYLDRIIVIWGDFDRPITPQSYSWPHIHVPIFLVNTSRNSLNDRFMPLSLIRTEGVLSIDDDFNVDHGTIEFSFRVWRENRARIVGPNYRIGYLQQSDNYDVTGIYIGPPREEPVFQHCQYNIVLTSGAFIHRDFLTSYSNEMPAEIRAHVDSITNCEDIAMAFWVSYLTRNGPLKTTPIGNTIGVFVQNSTGLSSRPGHFAQRAKCIKLFSKILGHNPLVISEYRADSLLYNQHAFTTKKCFNNE